MRPPGASIQYVGVDHLSKLPLKTSPVGRGKKPAHPSTFLTRYRLADVDWRAECHSARVTSAVAKHHLRCALPTKSIMDCISDACMNYLPV
ncbi:hypothetical protein P8C59_002886 [Phyllachora maydis]|uniref:Uncharacterized protein n=1 Tax=Phyllachora maydis TaxID=1825666 RepID=A0AAD9M8J2_9PEZI|nr:hypothetical protein P8C59_002886 [Phyllachora maydis]